MSDETDKKIKERLEGIFPEPVAGRIVDLVVSEKPMGWSRHSNATYYKPIYAQQMKADVDRMIEAKNQPLVYRYSVYCSGEGDMSEGTLYSRINQSIRYLIEKYGTQADREYYRKWYQTVSLKRVRGLGIIIKFIQGMEGAQLDNFKGDLTTPPEEMPKWKMEMEEWLEGTSIQPFCKEGLALTPDEIKELKNSFIGITSVMASITSHAVKIIRKK
jgi:hypothetical protein